MSSHRGHLHASDFIYTVLDMASQQGYINCASFYFLSLSDPVFFSWYFLSLFHIFMNIYSHFFSLMLILHHNLYCIVMISKSSILNLQVLTISCRISASDTFFLISFLSPGLTICLHHLSFLFFFYISSASWSFANAFFPTFQNNLYISSQLVNCPAMYL